MTKKYFVVADIHSFYIEMKQALQIAGFRKKNKDHILIVIGDIFDRGPDAVAVYKYIHSLPKCRRILIKGNHEDLYEELLNKKYPQNHDFHNMTVDTFCQIAQSMDPYNDYNSLFFESGYHDYYGAYFGGDEVEPECQELWDKVKELVSKSEITKWIKSDEWKNYYELGPFIFTHSFIPTDIKEEFERALYIYARSELKASCFQYKPNWRDSSEHEWFESRWGSPWGQYRDGLFKQEEDNGKVLVCGHWHTSDFFKNLKNDYTYIGKPAPIYYSKGLIGIDGGCTYNNYLDVWDHPQNVLVIDENFNCSDKFGYKLVEIEEESDYIIRETVSVSDLSEKEREQLFSNDSPNDSTEGNEEVKK